MVKVQLLDGNKLKISFISLFLLIITQSCFQKKENNSSLQKSSNNTEVIQKADSLIINTIKEFYISYISENIKNKVDRNTIREIKDKYVTKKLLQHIEKQMASGSLDWDPFVNAQDFYDGWIKTLKVEKDKSKPNLYVVSYYNGIENEKIYLRVLKDFNQYKISKIETYQIKKEECFYENLIKDRAIRIERLSNNKSKISVIDIKNDTVLQQIDYDPYSFNFECKSSIYDSNVNIHNDYEIVIGDYNFDGLQDFAILNDNTINTGTIFSYFFQNKHGQFYQNKNFPLNLIPSKIDNKKKTLTQQNIIGCCKIATNVYQLKDDIWLNILSEEMDMDKH